MRRLKFPLALALVAGLQLTAQAQSSPPAQSALDARLFYQVLIGEMEAQRGELGTAYQVLLDAARRTGDEGLFRRVIGLALQARAGNEALTAAQSWRRQTGSLAAQQHVARLAVALGRLDEAAPALVDWLEQTADTQERAALLASVPQLLRNIPERERPLNAMEPSLAALRDNSALPPQRRQLAACLFAALALHADNDALALNQLRQAESERPADALPAWMALGLIHRQADAETLVQRHLSGQAALHTAYARTLARGHRSLDAWREFQALKALEPDQVAHRYALATLELDLHQPRGALVAIDEYLTRLPEKGADDQRMAGLLLKAQALERQRRWADALRVLDTLPEAAPSADAVFRRASIEAQQGRLDQARQRIRDLPVEGPEQRQRLVLLEVQLLRDTRQWAAALDLLNQSLSESPTDVDLLYEQAMSAERLGQLELMERQLRRVIELNPRHHHAHNALGYSLAERNERLPEARALIERAIALAGQEPFLVDSLGWVAFREGRLDEAERWLRQAHRSRPDAEIAAHLAELLWAQGKVEEARTLAREAQAREPDNAVVLETRKRLGL